MAEKFVYRPFVVDLVIDRDIGTPAPFCSLEMSLKALDAVDMDVAVAAVAVALREIAVSAP